jgi:hypothetical protein
MDGHRSSGKSSSPALPPTTVGQEAEGAGNLYRIIDLSLIDIGLTDVALTVPRLAG